MTNLSTVTIKPGQIGVKPATAPMGHEGCFEVCGKDDVLLISVCASNDTVLEILPGNTALAGGSKFFEINCTDEVFIYLESGPFVTVEKDGRRVIKIVADNDEAEIYALQLH